MPAPVRPGNTPSVRETVRNRPPKPLPLLNDKLVPKRPPGVRPASGMCSSKEIKMTKNLMLRSQYCQEELAKPGVGRRLGKTTSNTTTYQRSETGKGSEDGCDVVFIRKLLALNKKEEMLLNKKLAKLLRNEELHKDVSKSVIVRAAKNTSYIEFTSSTSTSDDDIDNTGLQVNEKRFVYEKLPAETVSVEVNYKSPRKHYRRPQYDLNGRRVYFDTEEEEIEIKEQVESETENSNLKIIKAQSKTWINTTTLIKTKSDVSCASDEQNQVTSHPKSLTVINQPARAVTRKKAETCSVKSCHTRGPRTNSSSCCKGSNRGDGTHNVVIHCCEVPDNKPSSKPKKRVQKVWNFHSITKLKPEHCASGDGDTANDEVQMEAVKPHDIGGGSDFKAGKDGTNSKLKTETTHTDI